MTTTTALGVAETTMRAAIAAAGRIPSIEPPESAALVAQRMANAVRSLEARRLSVDKAIQACSDVLGLRSCATGIEAAIQREDLKGACELVLRFRAIERAAEAGGEAYETSLASARLATARVNKIVRERYFEACAAREGLESWLELLEPLGLANDACVSAFLEYARHVLREAVATSMEQEDRLQKVINNIAACVTKTLPLCEKLGDATKKQTLILAHDACETAALAVVARFASERRLASIAARAARRDPEDYCPDDDTLEDVATVLQRLETWDRFVRHAGGSTVRKEVFDASRLSQAAAEMSGWYAALESRALETNLATAQRLDNIKKLTEGSSSSADDSFYACRETALRAVGCGNARAAQLVLDDLAAQLQKTVFRALSTRTHKAIAKGAFLEAQIALNTMERASRLLSKLNADVSEEIRLSYGHQQNKPHLFLQEEERDNNSEKKLSSVTAAREAYASTIAKKLPLPSLPSIQQYASSRYSLDERTFQSLQKTDDWPTKVQNLLEVPSVLSESNLHAVAGLVASQFGAKLEEKCGGGVTVFGAMQLDRDVRAFRAILLTSFNHAPTIRDGLARIQLVATILSVEDAPDVAFFVPKCPDLARIVSLRHWSDSDRALLDKMLHQDITTT
ncbi:hypothetical protein CTAYLR_000600 [Chrysophaeum taylorii]|uniref:Uncharacterized protein n=1 Tax=Chrysophaeum taylorii TaxID=2483200 RepID=A0AAD7UGX9_9STRA|nr:hypothetical protein CTAYLR_000600 [Chrysophaeum taylorii]